MPKNNDKKVDKYLKTQKEKYKDIFILTYDENKKFFLQKKDEKKDNS